MGIMVGVLLGAILNVKVASSIYVADRVTVVPAAFDVIVAPTSQDTTMTTKTKKPKSIMTSKKQKNKANGRNKNKSSNSHELMDLGFLPPDIKVERQQPMLRKNKKRRKRAPIVLVERSDLKPLPLTHTAATTMTTTTTATPPEPSSSAESSTKNSAPNTAQTSMISSAVSNPLVNHVLRQLEEVRSHAIQESQQKKLSRPLRLPSMENAQQEMPRVVLLRAIGNPLPPRHDPEQAIRNLNFTLMYEPDYEEYVDKHWVLNRLVDPDLESRLIALLDKYQKPYTRIPFELDVYDRIPYDFKLYEPDGVADIIHNTTFHEGRFPNVGQVEEAISNAKNLYVTNQNAARNVMLDIGVQQYPKAEFILPWDGNCFVHPNAMENILSGLYNVTTSKSTQRYFYTPMNRAVENEEVFDSEYRPAPIEEPQVIFHRSAEGRFQPNLRYGRRNKVEMLQRMRIPGPWDKWSKYLDWEKRTLGPIRRPLTDLQEPAERIGFVTRLSSGRTHLEVKGTIHQRGESRVKSMLRLLSKLDSRAARDLHGFDSSNFMFYNEQALERDRDVFQNPSKYPEIAPKLQTVTQELLELAREALKQGPWSVVDKPTGSVAPSNDPHDYYHPAPYFWPVMFENGTIDEFAKYQRRDGQRVPGTVLYDELSDLFDRTRLTAMQYNTTVLGLAYYMTGREMYGEKAAHNIRRWFLDPETRMNPSLSFAQIRRNHHNNTGFSFGVIEMKDVYFMLDAVRMVERGGFFTEKESAELRVWFREYMDWLETSEMGRTEYTAGNNHGLYYDVQLISIAAFVNNTDRLMWYVDRSVSRMLAHFKENGEMPHEMNRPICEHYQMFTLQGWATLSRMAESVGHNLWNEFTQRKADGTSGSSIMCRAARFSIPFYRNRPVCKPGSDIDNVQRWQPLLQDARNYCPTLINKDKVWPVEWFPNDAQPPPQHAYDMPSVFYPHDGIAPFWNLGLPSSNNSNDLLRKQKRKKEPVYLRTN